MIRLFFLGLLGISLPVCADALQSSRHAMLPNDFTITWVFADTPPFHIERPAFPNQLGICDGVMEEVIKATPHITHKKRLLPHLRIQQLMDAGKPVCYPCMIHRSQATERAQYAKPHVVYPPFKVIVHKDNAKKITESFGSPIDIQSLLNSREWVMSRQASRKFGSVLQPILESSLANEKSLMVYTSADANISAMKMIELGRADYGIEYPSNLPYLQSSGLENLTALDIALKNETFKLGAIGCSAKGGKYTETALGIINQALDEQVLNSPDYSKHLDYWFSETMPNYFELYEEHVLNNQLH